jgi:hypothetical protein
VPRNGTLENRGLGLSPALDTGPVFTCIVTGDPCVPAAAYLFFRRKLDGVSNLAGRVRVQQRAEVVDVQHVRAEPWVAVLGFEITGTQSYR